MNGNGKPSVAVLEHRSTMSRDIPVELIDADPDQPRQHFDPIALQEMADSLAANGQIVPITVRPVGDRFVIVQGERRWRGAQLVGLPTLRAEVSDISADEAYVLALVENVQRSDLSPIEEAHAFTRLVNVYGYAQSKVGELIGKSQQFVADRLSLLKLDEKVQELVTARAVNPSIARKLATIDDPKVQISLARQVARESLTVKNFEDARRNFERKAAEQRERAAIALSLSSNEVLAQYAAAIERGEIRAEGSGDRLSLRVTNLSQAFSGQPFHWPQYSGAEWLNKNGHFTEKYGRFVRRDGREAEALYHVPLFSEGEWQEWLNFNEAEALEALDFPGKSFFRWPFRHQESLHPARDKRYYDPDYGRLLAEDKHQKHLFVRRGWGEWVIVEFNDGAGSRTKRRYFAHDIATFTLIQQAIETVDPFAFSHHNFGRMEIWKAASSEMSWYYIRRRTLDRESAIAALEKDLEMLKQAKPLSDEEFTEGVLDFLQNFSPGIAYRHDWREGVCTSPRLPDGTVDIAIAYDELEASA